MSEPVPAVLVVATFLLLTTFTFFFLLNVWAQHNDLLAEAAARQQDRLETSLDISQVALDEDVCPNYAGPFEALVDNNGATSFVELDQMDLFLDYVDGSDNKVVSRLQHGSGWALTNLDPDARNPNQWDSAETGTVAFSLDPELNPDTSGVVLLAAPQGITNSRYFTCPDECNGVTGFLNPTAEAADSGGDDDGFEDSPEDAFADDGDAASSTNTLSSGDRHRFFDYGFSVHPACVIQGIEVRIDWWLLETLANNSMAVELSWDGGTSWTSPKTDSTETTSEHTTVLGSDSDTWGHPWQPSDLSDSNFRVRVTTNTNAPAQTFFLDWVAVNVFFSPP